MAGIYANARFSNMRQYSLSSRLLSIYLRQPYTWFLERSSSDVSRRVLSEVSSFIGKVLTPSLELVSAGLITLAIIGFLLAVDPIICIATALIIGGGYLAIYFWQRRRLKWIGKELVRHNQTRYQLTQEAMGGFKEVKLMGLERGYSRRFETAALEAARHGAYASVLQQLPRLALEAIVFGFLIGLVMVLLLWNQGDLAAIIPKLGIFAFATLRLLPALQKIYWAFTSILVGQASLEQIHDDFMTASRTAVDLPSGGDTRLSLEKAITLEKVAFSYPSSERTALRNVSLEIPKCTTVGIVGGTGAGKTTLVDLVLGLLTPDSGEIRIDDTPLSNDNLRSWQRSIGYVPQSIFLTEDSVRQNVAFGVPPESIDDQAVERASRLAALHDFVMSDLPDGYETLVGERGVRLSGGQRQRIGIARALYHSPSLLILDEATSALDNITERVVMEAVETIRQEMTIIMIAHRLSTVRNCDVIHVMENGSVASSGTYDELLRDSALFQRMAVGS
jgi:ABC-type multidrug transport system fused ATPase/permease subunit